MGSTFFCCCFVWWNEELTVEINNRTLIGILTASGAVARLTGPVWAAYLYEDEGEAPVFAVTAGLLLFAAVIFGLCYRKINQLISANNPHSAPI
jgi:hypothetical protein